MFNLSPRTVEMTLYLSSSISRMGESGIGMISHGIPN